jgi:hypothetical protein
MSPEDQIVNALSHWLAGHVSNDELRGAIEEVGPERLSGEHGEAVEELFAELDAAQGERRGGVEKAVRETLEHLAFG